MNVPTLQDFDNYFNELHGHAPYDWQRRLARKVIAGSWPDIIDLPTGSGKTACLDISIFALAYQSTMLVKERTAPRRIFFCVNRRVIVDEAYQRAKKIAQAIWEAERESGRSKPVLQLIASALRTISGISDQEIPPLDVLELRGGIYRDNRWARSVTQPTIVCTTIDQLGSRLLFRGYGVSSGAAPIQAALIAYDSLVLLDEAHISRPFLQSLQWVEQYLNPDKWAEQSIGVSRMRVVPMTATPPQGTNTNDVLQLKNADRQNKGLNERLVCNKLANLKSVDNVVDAAVAVAKNSPEGQPTAIGVIVNRVATAKEIYRKIREQHSETVVELVIGSMRPLDRDLQTNRLQSLVGPDRPKKTGQTSFVVATQCLEVGADYDFDVLITECASLDSLRQRFGRLNRGGRPIPAKAVILIDEKQVKEESKLDDKKPLDPIYGNALPRTWNWLWEYAEATTTETEPTSSEDSQPKKRKRKPAGKPTESRSVNFGINAFNRLLEEHSDDGRIPETLLSPSSKLDTPVMLPAYIDLWCQTNPQPLPDPDVSLFIHGLQEGGRDVQVCWRADFIEDDAMTFKHWLDVVSLLPPTAAECMSVPIGRFKRWLLDEHRIADDETDLLITNQQNDSENGRLRTPCVLWKGVSESTLLKNVRDLYPGCTVVLPSSAQGWEELGHIPEPNQPTEVGVAEKTKPESDLSSYHEIESADHSHLDVAEPAFLQAKDRAVVRLHPVLKFLRQKVPAAQNVLDRLADDESPPSTPELRQLCSEVMREFLNDIDIHDVSDVQWEFYPDRRGLVITTRRRLDRVTEWYLPSLDDGEDQPTQTLRQNPVLLSNHTAHVVAEMDATLQRLPFPALDEVYRIAAELHDWGKADERFQALLRRTDRSDAWLFTSITSRLLAKSDSMPQTRNEREASRIRAGLPKGFRHEMLSLQLAEKSSNFPDDPLLLELILHLIAAHHGYARPFAPVVIDDDPPEVFIENVNITTADRLAFPPHRLDSGITERFWILTKRYGWWGLAYLEAVIRLADQQASAKECDGQYDDQAQEVERNELKAPEVAP
ncbi:type I-G CRISPR-associated helicase/endonuclease Cas3g [Gimesia panareensis]|uniref:type I-G CRISPR-associated helicase/endonuclease Cas3g n=1 Tax=Gimesia panareensis TaxID=2527978 RepID=UPI001187D7C6|nr:type I-U CRISPR-associated helicase/endonuclease Cas3 [Gimesia panareensis]QDU47878.1 CRISPR-associated nuclease/helicase Cas3 [Gimesia panareensis]